MDDSSRPNCYNCKYRGTLPGNAHSQCKHPINADLLDNPMAQVFGILAGVGRIGLGLSENAKKLNIVGHPTGVKRGWFIWPVNFDPVWLQSCDGFEEKDEQ